MTAITEFREARALASQGLEFGRPDFPDTRLASQTTFLEYVFRALWVGLAVCVLGYALAWVMGLHRHADSFASIGFGIGSLWGFLLPYSQILWRAIRYRRKPDWYELNWYSGAEKLAANLLIALYVGALLGKGYGWLLAHHWLKPLFGITDEFNAALVLSVVIFVLLYVWLVRLARTGYRQRPQTQPASRLQKKAKAAENVPFGLWLGETTGMLAKRWHLAGLAAGQQVGIFGDEAAQNILILGRIGAGKTTRAIHPLLLQLLDQQCGGLIFDIKGDFEQAVDHFSTLTQRSYQVIGIHQTPFNLLQGLSPEIAASFLKSAFLLSGSHSHDSFWMDTATELCRNALGILAYLPAHYSLNGLSRYIFEPDWREERLQQLTLLTPTLPDDQQRLLQAYRDYEDLTFSHFDDKVKANVKATLAQILSPFRHPEFIDAFCTTPEDDGLQLEAMLEGAIFLVNLPLAHWGLGAKVVYTLIKLRFFNLMQQRALNASWNQTRPVFFLCDEYQEIISANKDGLSDLNFWDKSRSSKTVGIISAQSVSSFYAAIGHRDLANAILQNFRQKLCFRTEDEATIALLNRLLGQVEILKTSHTQSQGSSTQGWLEASSQQSSESLTVSEQEKHVIDGQFFRSLPPNHALALLTFGGAAVDDVLKLKPVFIEKPPASSPEAA